MRCKVCGDHMAPSVPAFIDRVRWDQRVLKLVPQDKPHGPCRSAGPFCEDCWAVVAMLVRERLGCERHRRAARLVDSLGLPEVDEEGMFA